MPVEGVLDMRTPPIVMTTLLLATATLGMTISMSQAQQPAPRRCESLWVERNSYYKDAGYCFKTSRAISYFGNAGCTYDNESEVPLSAGARNRIAQITRQEKALDCN
jgi:YARHG domain